MLSPIDVGSRHPPVWPEGPDTRQRWDPSKLRAGLPSWQALRPQRPLQAGKPEEMGQLRTDSQNRSNRRPCSRLGMRSLRASLWSTGKGGEAPSSALATPLLHTPVSSREARGIQCHHSRGTEARSRLPIQGTCSACPATNTILEI